MMRLLSLILLLPALGGCNQKKVDCTRLEQRLEPCRQEVYRALGGPEVRLLDELAGPGLLQEKARRQVAERWEPLRRTRAEALVGRLKSTCRRHDGRFLQAEAVSRCLELRGCQAFASCLAKALHVESAGQDGGVLEHPRPR